jgi:Flp pilus assembly pilin Flp
VCHKLIIGRRGCRTLFEDEAAATAAEYAILLALLILGSMGVIRSIGGGFRGLYLAICAAIPDAEA